MANSNSIKSLVLFGLLSTILVASYLFYGLYQKMEYNSTIERVILIKRNAEKAENIILEELEKVETRRKNYAALDEAARKVELESIAFKKIVNGFSVPDNEVLKDRTERESFKILCDSIENAILKLEASSKGFSSIVINLPSTF